MGKERRVGDQARHGDERPAGEPAQPLARRLEPRHAVGRVEGGEALQELGRRIVAHQTDLPVVERAPDGVFGRAAGLPVLGDGPVGGDVAVIAAQAGLRGNGGVGRDVGHGVLPRKKDRVRSYRRGSGMSLRRDPRYGRSVA